MLKLESVSKTYGRKRALKNVSLELPQGEIVGLFGENGAGKSTLIKCILQLIRYEGAIALDGQPITRKNIARLSYATSEHSCFPGLTADGHRDFYAEHFSAFDQRRYDALMHFFDLPHQKPLASLSTGQKNQFEVILALCQGADYILLDEPFAGNDVFNREDFYKVLLGILEPHETILLSTHLIEEVEHFIGRAILLRRGKIVGDVTTLELEEQGRSVLEYIKTTYAYEGDRVSKALRELTGKEE